MSPADTRLVRIFVASPGDVVAEREALRSVVDEIERDLDEDGVALRLVGWETDARPGVGVDAQDVINRQLPSCDLVVAILWNRLGTPTKRAESGTVEELELALARWEQNGDPVLVYSKTAPFRARTPAEAAQLGSVLTFRERLHERGVLDREFETTEEFKDLVRPHLRKEIRDLVGQRVATRAELSPPASPSKAGARTHTASFSVEVLRQDASHRELRIVGAGGVRTLAIRGGESFLGLRVNADPVAEVDGVTIALKRRPRLASDSCKGEFAMTHGGPLTFVELTFIVTDFGQILKRVRLTVGGAVVYSEST